MGLPERNYYVRAITGCSLAGVGALCGVPHARVALGSMAPKARYRLLTAHQIVDELFEKIGHNIPKWFAIVGDTSQADCELLLCLRVRTRGLVYVETKGNRSMWDDLSGQNGRLPMFDHVCLRPRETIRERIYTELFHSVIVDLPVPFIRFDGFRKTIDALAYNGPRYFTAKSVTPSVKRTVIENPKWALSLPVS